MKVDMKNPGFNAVREPADPTMVLSRSGGTQGAEGVTVKKTIVVVTILGLVFFGVGTVLSPGEARAEKLIFSLDWVTQPPHAYYYSALDRGLYQKAGLDIVIQRGFGSADTMKRIATKASEFGFADAGGLVVARSKGAIAKEVAMIYSKAMYAIQSLSDKPILTPKDLAGSRIGTNQGTSQYVLFPALASANNLDMKKIKWNFMTPSAIIPSLIAGKIDGGFSYAVMEPSIRAKAKSINKKMYSLLYADWGVDIYSNGLVVRDELIANNPKRVRAFVEATMKGVAWTVEHPAEAAAILTRYKPALDLKQTLAGLKLGIKHLMSEEAKKHGIGYMTEEKMRRTRDIVTKHMKLKTVIPVKDLYTNEFLPKLFPKEKKD